MSQRKISFIEGEYYHIYNRGNSKQVIFHDADDHERFISLLYIANSDRNFKLHLLARSDLYSVDRGQQLVAMGAWTLMPNHFHLLLTSRTENGVSKFMQKVTTAYSMYYNQKYKRTGGLFEGRFKSQHVADDQYLKYLYAYIHLNCLKLLNDKKLDTYVYSSYQDYSGDNRALGNILSPSYFPLHFADEVSFNKDMNDWIMYRSDLAK